MNYRKKIEQWNKETLDLIKDELKESKYSIIGRVLYYYLESLYDTGELSDEGEANALYLMDTYWGITNEDKNNEN